jgi:hypothetical protein
MNPAQDSAMMMTNQSYIGVVSGMVSSHQGTHQSFGQASAGNRPANRGVLRKVTVISSQNDDKAKNGKKSKKGAYFLRLKANQQRVRLSQLLTLCSELSKSPGRDPWLPSTWLPLACREQCADSCSIRE